MFTLHHAGLMLLAKDYLSLQDSLKLCQYVEYYVLNEEVKDNKRLELFGNRLCGA